MKLRSISLFVIGLLVFLTISQISLNSNAYAYYANTDTTLTVPSKLMNLGQTYPLKASVKNVDNTLGIFGMNVLYQATVVSRIGSTKFTNSYQNATHPVFTWTQSQDEQINGFRIPVKGVTLDSQINWKLKNGLTTIVDGVIDTTGARAMVKKTGTLWLLFNSSQVSSSYPSSVILTKAVSYTLELNYNGYTVTQIQFPKGQDGTLYLFDGGSNTGSLVAIESILTSVLKKETVTPSSITYNYVPNRLGSVWLLSYFTDDLAIFSPSFDGASVVVTQASSLSFNFPPVVTYYNKVADISLFIKDSGLPVTGITVDFSIYYNTFWVNIGSSLSSSGGIATVPYTPLISEGLYLLKADMIIQSKEYHSISNFTVNLQSSKINILGSKGFYGSGDFPGSSLVSITGNLLDSSNVPLVNQELNFYKFNTQFIGRVTTGSSGSFQFNFLQNTTVGIFPNYVYAVHNSQNYKTTSINISTEILKGNPRFYNLTTPVNTSSPTITLSGRIEASTSNLLNASIDLYTYNSTGLKWTYTSSTTSIFGLFNFTVANPGAKVMNYRYVFTGSSYYNAMTYDVILNISKSSGYASRLGLLDTKGIQVSLGTPSDPIQYINYHGGNFSFYVKDKQNRGISGADVTLYSRAYNGSFKDYQVGTFKSNKNGLVNIQWTLPKGFDSLNFFKQQFLVGFPYLQANIQHANYSFALTQFYWNLTGLQIIGTTTNQQFFYNSPTTVKLNVTDTLGLPIEDGALFNLYLNSKSLGNIKTVGGQIAIPIIFNATGIQTLLLSYTSPYNVYPYLNSSLTFDLMVNKASYKILIPTTAYNVHIGQTVNLNATVLDGQNKPMSNLNIDIWYYNGAWVKISTPTPLITDSNGYVSMNYKVLLTYLGSYVFEWRLPENINFRSTTQQFQLITTAIETRLTVQNPSSITYSSSTYGNLTLQDALGNKLSNQVLSFSLGSYSWVRTTDVNGFTTFALPNSITPGTYQLNVTFAGQGSFLKNTSLSTLQVTGMKTSLKIYGIQVGKIYVADRIHVGIQAVDELKNPISSATLNIYLDGSLLTLKTDSSGFANFTYTIPNEKNFNLTVQMNSFLGYEKSQASISSAVYKRSVVITDLTNPQILKYNHTVYFLFLIQTDNYLPVSGATVNVTFKSLYSSISIIGYTNSTGYMTLNYTLDSPAGSLLLLSIHSTHLSYLDGTTSISRTILEDTFNRTVNLTELVYTNNSRIQVIVTNSLGDPLKGMQVTVTYNLNSVTILIGQGLTDSKGYVTFTFNVRFTMSHELFLLIEDKNFNFHQFSENIKVFSKAPTGELYVKMSEINSNPAITGTISINTVSPPEVNVLLYIFSGSQWTIMGNISTVNGGFAFVIPQSTVSEQYKVEIGSNSYVLGNSKLITTKFQSIVNVSLLNSTVERYDIFHPMFVVKLDNGSILQSYFADIYWINYGTGGSTYTLWGRYDTRSINSLNTTVVTGNYKILVVIPNQGWIRQNVNSSFSLTVAHEKYSVQFNDVKVNRLESVTLRYILLDNDGQKVSGVSATLSIQINGSWTSLASSSIKNGILEFMIKPDVPFGTYNIQLTASSTSVYAGVILHARLSILQSTTLTLINSQSIQPIYTDGLNVSIRLTENSYGQGLSNQSVRFTLLMNNKIFFSFETFTNQSGFITLHSIFRDVVPGSIYTLTVQFNGNSLLSSSSVNYTLPTTQKETVRVLLDRAHTKDYGVTFNQTLAFSVNDETGVIHKGSVKWLLLQFKNGNWINTGVSGKIQLGSSSYYSLYFSLTGSYRIIFEYQENTLFVQGSPLIVDLGWRAPTPVIEVKMINTSYLGTINQTFYVYNNGNSSQPLYNVSVYISTPWGKTTMQTNRFGAFTLLKSSIDLKPGRYTLYISTTGGVQISSTATEVPMNVNPRYESFKYKISDQFWDRLINGTLSDQVNNASYDIIIYSNNSIIYSRNNLTSSELLQGFYSQIHQGQDLNYNITRHKQNYADLTLTGKFMLLDIPIQISVTPTFYNGTGLFQLTTIDLRTQLSLNGVPIKGMLVIGNQTFTLDITETSFLIHLPITNGTIYLSLNAGLGYTGTNSQVFSFNSPLIFQKLGQQNGFAIPMDVTVISTFVIGALIVKYVNKKGFFKRTSGQ